MRRRSSHGRTPLRSTASDVAAPPFEVPPPMQTLTRIAELRELVTHWRLSRESIAFVPTMGNLHVGHASLMAAAHLHGRRVVSSVFVNPLQFGPSEDYSAYPRTLPRRLAVAGRIRRGRAVPSDGGRDVPGRQRRQHGRGRAGPHGHPVRRVPARALPGCRDRRRQAASASCSPTSRSSAKRTSSSSR